MGGAGSALKVLKLCPGGAQEGFAVGAAAARMVQGGAHLARTHCSRFSTRLYVCQIRVFGTNAALGLGIGQLGASPGPNACRARSPAVFGQACFCFRRTSVLSTLS